MARKPGTGSTSQSSPAGAGGRPSALVDPGHEYASRAGTRIIYCGDCLDELSSEPRPSGSGLLPQLPAGCVYRVNLWHRFPTGERNSNCDYEVFWGAQSEPRASASGSSPWFEDRHAPKAAHIDHTRPRCVELARVLKKTGSFYYHCDWHTSHRAKWMIQADSEPGRPRRGPGARGFHSALRDEVTQ